MLRVSRMGKMAKNLVEHHKAEEKRLICLANALCSIPSIGILARLCGFLDEVKQVLIDPKQD